MLSIQLNVNQNPVTPNVRNWPFLKYLFIKKLQWCCHWSLVVILPHGFTLFHVNSSPPSAAYMRQWIGSALVQIMACRLYGAKPLSEPMLECCSFKKMHLKMSSARMVAILSPGRCDNASAGTVMIKFRSSTLGWTWTMSLLNHNFTKIDGLDITNVIY